MNFLLKSAVLSVILTAGFSSSVSYADVYSSAHRIKTQSLIQYHAKQGNLLADSLAQVEKLSGITFKIDTELGKDVVSRTVDADNWNIAIRALLANYNFATIQESETIKTVIISGRNKDIVEAITAPPVSIASVEDQSFFEHPVSIMQIEREMPDEY